MTTLSYNATPSLEQYLVNLADRLSIEKIVTSMYLEIYPEQEGKKNFSVCSPYVLRVFSALSILFFFLSPVNMLEPKLGLRPTWNIESALVSTGGSMHCMYASDNFESCFSLSISLAQTQGFLKGEVCCIRKKTPKVLYSNLNRLLLWSSTPIIVLKIYQGLYFAHIVTSITSTNKRG